MRLRGNLPYAIEVALSNVCLVIGSTYIRVSLKCIVMRSKQPSALNKGERKCGQSKSQAVEPST